SRPAAARLERILDEAGYHLTGVLRCRVAGIGHGDALQLDDGPARGALSYDAGDLGSAGSDSLHCGCKRGLSSAEKGRLAFADCLRRAIGFGAGAAYWFE